MRIGLRISHRSISSLDRTCRIGIYRILTHLQPAADLMLTIDAEAITLEVLIDDHPLLVIEIAGKAIRRTLAAPADGDIGIRHIPIAHQRPLPVRTLGSIIRIT